MAELIPFEVANRAVSHLGRHLYGSTPPALAELIANAYDAYAKRVWIKHQDMDGNGRGRIVVGDNGLGMDVDALKAHYGTAVGILDQKSYATSPKSLRYCMGLL